LPKNSPKMTPKKKPYFYNQYITEVEKTLNVNTVI